MSNQSVIKKSDSCGGNGVQVLDAGEARKMVGNYLTRKRQKPTGAAFGVSQVSPPMPLLSVDILLEF